MRESLARVESFFPSHLIHSLFQLPHRPLLFVNRVSKFCILLWVKFTAILDLLRESSKSPRYTRFIGILRHEHFLTNETAQDFRQFLSPKLAAVFLISDHTKSLVPYDLQRSAITLRHVADIWKHLSPASAAVCGTRSGWSGKLNLVLLSRSLRRFRLRQFLMETCVWDDCVLSMVCNKTVYKILFFSFILFYKYFYIKLHYKGKEIKQQSKLHKWWVKQNVRSDRRRQLPIVSQIIWKPG